MEHQRVGTQNTHRREAARAGSRPGIAVAITQKHIKQYKTCAFYDLDYFYNTATWKIIFYVQNAKNILKPLDLLFFCVQNAKN